MPTVPRSSMMSKYGQVEHVFPRPGARGDPGHLALGPQPQGCQGMLQDGQQAMHPGVGLRLLQAELSRVHALQRVLALVLGTTSHGTERSDSMLHTHGRYDYSNITERPDYSWPGGKRLAVYVAVNIEQFRYGAGKGAAIAPPDQAHSHSVFSWRDYGNRVGIWRLFELLDELGMPAEAQMNTAIYEAAPDIPERLRARGDEILGHGVTNSDEQGHLSEDQERALIAGVTATITKHEGAAPVGWMSPWLSNSTLTMDLLQEAGYRYVMDWTMDDQPIWFRPGRGGFLAMPYPIEVNDTRGIVWYRYTADEFADLIVDQFDEMLAQSARQPLVCPISLHAFVTGRPYRIRRLRRALQHVRQHRDRVWLTRPRDICAHVESLPTGIVPGGR